MIILKHSVIFFTLLLLFLGCGVKEAVPPMQEVVIAKADVVVEDGDTFVYKGQRVRMLGIDTPETDSPYHEGNQEPYGSQAKEFLVTKIIMADELKMIRIAQNDKYDRWLAYLLLDGVNVNAELVRAGHAYETVTHYGAQGLDAYAVQVRRAADVQPEPQFEKPWEWRKKHRKTENQ